MGNWKYYIVRMKMREIANEIQLAHDIYEDNTLSEAVQRTLNTKRVHKDITGFLARRPDRFFSSIVVAALEGEPSWFPVEMDTDIVPQVFARSKTLKDSFGILSFGDEPKYYALDGQHRVAAIKYLLSSQTDYDPPQGFQNDLLSVIVVLREEHDVSEGEWMRRYRRLFSSLNRYARKTGADTNIIMDEDDLFAILTRRLITDHEFFKAPGRQKESFKVLTQGKALRESSPHFTSLQTLYIMNRKLLMTLPRKQRGWFSQRQELQYRPDEEFIDKCYEELDTCWNAILNVLPFLKTVPASGMRQHNAVADSPSQDNLLFWPIGQELFASLVRNLLNEHFPNNEWEDLEGVILKLKPLSMISWNLHKPPWRYLLLVTADQSAKKWRMRSEDRKQALEVAGRLLRWMLMLDCLDEQDTVGLRKSWSELLYVMPNQNEVDEMWETILATRDQIISSA